MSSGAAGSGSGAEDSEMDPDGIVQGERAADPGEAKPKMKGVKFVVFPPRNKDSELSSLCSIM